MVVPHVLRAWVGVLVGDRGGDDGRVGALMRPMHRAPAFVLASLLVLGVAPAQTTAPCTGIVRDVDATPLAGAEVVAAWRPNAAFGRAARRTATTGADGRFAFDVAVGSAHWIWAIGPADARGHRAVVVPTDRAAGGAELALRAGLRMPPRTLAVVDSAPWIAAGPLALRMGITEDTALGPDIALPGDGPIVLPPLPTDRIWVALVDGSGRELTKALVDFADAARVAFPMPRVFDARVVDEQGRAVAGAQIVRYGAMPLRASGDAGVGFARHVVATTDGDGLAHCRVPESQSLLVAEAPGHAGAVSGWRDGARCENGQAVADDERRALAFVLRTRAGSRVRLAGGGPDTTLRVQCTELLRAQVGRRTTYVVATSEALREANGEVALPFAEFVEGTTAVCRIEHRQDVPRATHAPIGQPGAVPAELALALRTFAVQVVDAAGAAVPCAVVGLVHAGAAEFEPVVEIVTDRGGRAEFQVAGAAGDAWGVRATDATRAGFATVPAVGDQPVRLVMQPVATMRVRCVDDGGRPLAGARIEWAGGGGPVRGQAPSGAEFERACMAADTRARARLDALRTDGEGLVDVPFVDAGQPMRVTARAGKATSDPFELRVSTEPAVVPVR